MRSKVLLITVLLLSTVAFGQTGDVWIRFYDTTIEKSGYKDLNGIIKIPAKFEQLTQADTFYNIIAVQELVDSSYVLYYLLKDGRKVGRDSVFLFDFTADCESEGKILFKDHKKERVGFLDKEGRVIIPALYNYASPFRNGMAIAYRNAIKQCWNKKADTMKCEHWSWVRGETILINERNEILADSVNVDLSNLNWYSGRINDPHVDTSVFVTIKGRQGNTYSFLNYEKEFRQWFATVFIPSLQSPAFREHLFSEITYWSDEAGWTSLDKDAFIKNFPAVLNSDRFRETPLKKVSLGADLFNTLIFEKPLYNKYLGACAAHNADRFPLFCVLLNYHKKRVSPFPTRFVKKKNVSAFDQAYELDYQEHYEFLRTEEGYRLLSVTFNK